MRGRGMGGDALWLIASSELQGFACTHFDALPSSEQDGFVAPLVQLPWSAEPRVTRGVVAICGGFVRGKAQRERGEDQIEVKL